MSTSSPSVQRSLSVTGLTTPIFRRGQSLVEFIIEHLPESLIQERMILAITSKIVSVAEARFVPESLVKDKKELIKKEAEVYLGEIGYGTHLTIKEGLFIASAGIDQSNSENGDFLLYPEDPFKSAMMLWQKLREAFALKEMGVILTDSHTTPLRRGVTGISLSHWGFEGVEDKRGQADLFGRELKVTTINWADALAVSATAVMGEGAECCPLAVVSGASVQFSEVTDPKEVRIPLEEDMYLPFFESHLSSKKL